MSTPDVEKLIAQIVKREGGYVNHRSDKGGPTKYGITHKTLAKWRGVHSVTAADVEALTVEEAERIYLERYVVKPGFMSIAFPNLQRLVVDSGVLFGPDDAAKWLQMAANVVGANLKVDGIVGPKTIKAVNIDITTAASIYAVVAVLRAKEHGKNITRGAKVIKRYAEENNLRQLKRANQGIFAEGWLNRLADEVIEAVGHIPRK